MADREKQAGSKDEAAPVSKDAAAAKGGGANSDSLASAAMAAVRRMLAANPGKAGVPAKPAAAPAADAKSPQGAAGAAPAHPMAAGAGEKAGVALGVLVTEALRLFPDWNKAVVDDKGQPVQSVPGAVRQGDHDIEKRHEEVVGPKIAAAADKLAPGAVHDFLAGFGAGATAAPGDTYRLEAELSDHLRGTLDK